MKMYHQCFLTFHNHAFTTKHLSRVMILFCHVVEQISGKIWHNRGFNDKSVKTSKIVHLDLLNKIGYGPIA